MGAAQLRWFLVTMRSTRHTVVIGLLSFFLGQVSGQCNLDPMVTPIQPASNPTGQVFLAPCNGIISNITVELNRFFDPFGGGSVDGTYQADLYDGNLIGIDPTTRTPLGNASVFVASTESQGARVFDFSGQGVAVTSSNEYSVLITESSTESGATFFAGSNPSPNGAMFQCPVSGACTESVGNDVSFSVAIGPLAPPPPSVSGCVTCGAKCGSFDGATSLRCHAETEIAISR